MGASDRSHPRQHINDETDFTWNELCESDFAVYISEQDGLEPTVTQSTPSSTTNRLRRPTLFPGERLSDEWKCPSAELGIMGKPPSSSPLPSPQLSLSERPEHGARAHRQRVGCLLLACIYVFCEIQVVIATIVGYYSFFKFVGWAMSKPKPAVAAE